MTRLERAIDEAKLELLRALDDATDGSKYQTCRRLVEAVDRLVEARIRAAAASKKR